ncbi:aminotransferase class I/II-fold pyridoxal phosphate-dependent enzyme [Megamonas funiformis]|uniref:aminotransferase class I/II-fold pyridoxal phosphate-dependent enzyme n=1 Tax=Megamonas funiformis TaxID=437897 RepID=UPI0022E39738|nr:aminotransferase class I/II-fold pyridoxal phosphate-dependent enzyme [Megamonas funiformis]
MFKRRDYFKEDRQKPWSIKDEPVTCEALADTEARTYPDMFEAYKNFAQTYNLSRDSFILTNGCENAVRIIFEALRPKYAYIENPSWGLVEVLANGLLYPRPEETPEEKRIFLVDYEFKNEKFVLGDYPLKLPQENSLFYITDKYNNVFEHEVLQDRNEYAKYTIVDETYSAKMLRNSNREIPENVFVIGSYSKFCGAGIRLGYILYNPKWNNLMQLLREECISKLAEKYTSIHIPEINLPEFDGDFVCKSNNYVIVKADSYTGDKRRINREFEVSGIKFYKLGLSLK